MRSQKLLETYAGDILHSKGMDMEKRFFQHGSLVCGLLRGIFRQAVGCGQRRKGFSVGLHQRFQLAAQSFGPGVQRLNVGFHGGVLLFADGQAAHHIAQRHTGCAHQCRSAAAARCGSFAGQFCQKLPAAFFHHFHV